MFKKALQSFLSAGFFVFGVALSCLLFTALCMSIFSSTPVKTVAEDYEVQVLGNHKGEVFAYDKQTPLILELPIHGVIGSAPLDRKSIRAKLRFAQNYFTKGQIKALILNFDTPGGGVTDSHGIFNVINAFKTNLNIPVYAFIDGLCASGGVYILASSDKVLATEVSNIGHVGVRMEHFNFYKGMEKLGIQYQSLHEGIGKDFLNPYTPINPDESKDYQAIIESQYLTFIEHLSKARPLLTKQKLIHEYGARVFLAQEALEKGFIDQIENNYNQVLKLVASDLNILQSDYQVISLRQGMWSLSALMPKSGQAQLLQSLFEEKALNLIMQAPGIREKI